MTEKLNPAIGYVGNALRSAAKDHITSFAEDTFEEGSQKYQSEINDELRSGKFDKENVSQESGESEDKVMSQKATSTELNNLDNAITVEKNRATAAEKMLENKTKFGFETNIYTDSKPINEFIKELYILKNGSPLDEDITIYVYSTSDSGNYTLSIKDGIVLGNINSGISKLKKDDYEIFMLSKSAFGYRVSGNIYYKASDCNLMFYPSIKYHYFEEYMINKNVFINDSKASKVIREIYCEGDWGVSDGKILVSEIDKKHTNYGTRIIFKNTNRDIIWIANVDSNSSFIITANGTKKLYAVLDWSVLEDGEICGINNYDGLPLNIYNNIELCPIIKQYMLKNELNNNIKKGKINLHNDPHFKFLIPKEIQKDISKDYLFEENTGNYVYSNSGLSIRIKDSSGHIRMSLKIRAEQLNKWGIQSGDIISIAFKVKVDSATKENFIALFERVPVNLNVRLEDSDWKLVSYNFKVSYTDLSELIQIVRFGVDNTRTENELLYIDGLSIYKADSIDDTLTSTLEPAYSPKQSTGKNIIADWDLKLSERYSKFFIFNTETSKPTKELGKSNYFGKQFNSLILNYSDDSDAYIQQDIILSNIHKSASFRRGIRIKITSTDEVQGNVYAAIYQARTKTSWYIENVFITLFKIGEWIDILSPSYKTNGEDYIHWSYRIEVPKGNYKVEIINPTVIPVEEDIYDFCITDNSESKLPLLNKKWTSLGDSLTDGGKWQLYVQEYTGAFPYIRGVGASAVMADMFPCWINPKTNEHITNILYNAYPPQLDVSSLNNFDENCVNFKGIFTLSWQIEKFIPSPQIGDYVWWANGQLTPTYNRRYYNGSTWVDMDDKVIDENEGVVYTTINGRISCEDRVNTIPEDSDIVTIMAGTNDNGNAGDEDDYNEPTFVGYYRRMIDLIYQRCPKATVIVCLFPKYGGEYNFEEKVLSSTGIKKQGYRDMLMSICKKYGYLLIDMQPSSNFQNMSQYLGSDLVHPTDEGRKYWAKVFTAQLLRCINS